MSNSQNKRQLLRYLIVGFSTVFVDFILYSVLLKWLDIYLAKTIAFASGSAWSYQLNRIWTFKAGPAKLKQFFKYGLIHFFGLIINVTINSLILTILPSNLVWRLNIAFLFATGSSAVINFLCIKFLVFNKSKP